MPFWVRKGGVSWGRKEILKSPPKEPRKREPASNTTTSARHKARVIKSKEDQKRGGKKKGKFPGDEERLIGVMLGAGNKERFDLVIEKAGKEKRKCSGGKKGNGCRVQLKGTGGVGGKAGVGPVVVYRWEGGYPSRRIFNLKLLLTSGRVNLGRVTRVGKGPQNRPTGA